MNLREFIAQAVIQIHQGVADANDAINGVCPGATRITPHPEEFALGVVEGNKPQALQFVEFDVAVTASKDESGKAGIGVVNLGLGANVDTRSVNEQVSRVRFKIPVVLPSDLVAQKNQ